MIDRQRVLDCTRGDLRRLIGKALQPQDPGVKAARRSPLVELEADLVGPIDRSGVAIQHALDVRSRIALVSQNVQGRTDHSIADEEIGRISGSCRVLTKAFGKLEGPLILPAGEAISKQSPQRA